MPAVTKDSSQTTPIYRLESVSFGSDKNHQYAVQIQPDTKAANGALLIAAASTGSAYSNLQLLDSGRPNGFLIFNPASNAFLANVASDAGLASSTIVAESASVIFGVTPEADTLTRFIWHFFLDEVTPQQGQPIKARWKGR